MNDKVNGKMSDEMVAEYYGADKPVEFKQLVYDLMNGELDLEHYPTAVSHYVKDEFEKDSKLDTIMREIYEAEHRIRERLKEDDQDVEIILGKYMQLCEFMSKKMYDYGVFFALQGMDSYRSVKPE